MRRTLLCFFLLTGLAIASQAQIKKGSTFLGGDISVNMQSQKQSGGTAKNNLIVISPVFGKAIRENLILGGNLNYSFAKIDNYNGNNTQAKINGYGAGVFLRKYKPIGNGGFYIFLQGSVNGNYSENKVKGVIGETVEKTKGITVSLSAYPGISYAISKKLHLETGFNNLVYVNYTHNTRVTYDPVNIKYTTNTFSAGTSLNNTASPFYLGFRILLGK